MSDRIEKEIELNAPVPRVWQAITDYQEFGRWFGVDLEAPFVVGKAARGHPTHEGYEHLVWEVVVQAIEPEHRFAFTWHPYAVQEDYDYASEPPTLVEFLLEPTATGTQLRIVESGFDKVPASRRAEAFIRNEGGWEQQLKNIAAHVTDNP